jgi:hypothetical protein
MQETSRVVTAGSRFRVKNGLSGVAGTARGTSVSAHRAGASFTQRNPRCCSDESAVQAIRALGL